MNPEYDDELDAYFSDVLGYPKMTVIAQGIFYSPYGATSLREYFANGFEAYFYHKDFYLKKVSPVLFDKLDGFAEVNVVESAQALIDKKIEEETLNSKWGWYAILCNIADNKFLDIEEITKKNFKECLTYMSYMSDYNQEQEKKINGRINT